VKCIYRSCGEISKQQYAAVAGEAKIFFVAPNSTGVLELSTIGSPFINAWFFRKSIFKSIGNFKIIFQIAAGRDFMLRPALSNLPLSTFDKLVYLYR
jgi:hypothetical protein